jgi:hypothetical protein
VRWLEVVGLGAAITFKWWLIDRLLEGRGQRRGVG